MACEDAFAPIFGAWLLILTMAPMLTVSPVSAEEQFFMGGKPVSHSFYDAGMLVNQGTILLRSNRNQEAADKLAQAVKIAPGMAEAHHDYALALAKLGKTDTALQEFKLALDLNPGLDSAWLSMGGLYQSSGNIANALAAYREFLTRFPQHQDAPKVASLVLGLEKEVQRSANVPVKVNADGKPSDDYFAEATRDGVVRWPVGRMPLQIFIHDGTDVQAYKPAFGQILRRSFDAWMCASNGLVQFKEVNDPKIADIEVFWLADGRKLVNDAESGETRVSKNSRGIVHSTIQLLTIPTLPEMPMTDNRMRQITLHEIGHALGITGHTNDPRDAMFFTSTLEDLWKDLSQRDANTIVRLYSQS
jgi:tetratricopeptide (TPR) repeat protein